MSNYRHQIYNKVLLYTPIILYILQDVIIHLTLCKTLKYIYIYRKKKIIK